MLVTRDHLLDGSVSCQRILNATLAVALGRELYPRYDDGHESDGFRIFHASLRPFDQKSAHIGVTFESRRLKCRMRYARSGVNLRILYRITHIFQDTPRMSSHHVHRSVI